MTTDSIMSYTLSLVTMVQLWHVTEDGTIPKDKSVESPIILGQKQRQIRAYPKNVNLSVLGQENLPLNRLQLLSSEERERNREKDI